MSGGYQCMGCERSNLRSSGHCQECQALGPASARPVFRADPGTGSQALLTSPQRDRIDAATVHLRPSEFTPEVLEWIRCVLVTRLARPGRAVTIMVTL